MKLAEAQVFDFIPAEIIAAENRANHPLPELNLLSAVEIDTLAPTQEVLRLEGIQGGAAIVEVRPDSVSSRLDIRCHRCPRGNSGE